MSERPDPAPEPTDDAPLGSPRYLERCFIPWPDENDERYDGWPMAKFGLRMVFYFDNAHEAPVRRALLTIVEQYLAAARQPIRRYAVAEDKRERYLAPGEAPDLTRLRERIGQPDSDWSINLSAERETRHPSHWSLLTLSAIKGGYLVVHFPFSFFEGAPRYALRDLFQRWCSALKVRQAYGGMGFVLPVEVGNQAAAMRRIGPYAMRFVALDTDLPTTTKLWCRDGIRC
ncbi:MAG: type VI immunity family protein, partial [Betaproteobacteria bacterium]